MTKLRKLSTGIFAMAIMLACSLQTWAQTGKSLAPTTASKPAVVQKTPAQAAKAGSPATVSTTPVGQKNSAQAALNDFKADSPIPQLNDLRKEILTNKAELEKAQMENRLSPADIAFAKEKIASQEQQMQPLVAREQRMLNRNANSVPQATSRQGASEYMKQHPQASTARVNAETPVAIAPVNVQRESTPSEIALKNFNANSPIPELNSMRQDQLQLKAELEAGQAENRLSKQEIKEYTTKIAAAEAGIQKLVPAEQKALKNSNAK